MKLEACEQRRYNVATSIIEERMTVAQGAEALKKSERQTRRIVNRVRKEGEKGVIHKSRGIPSPRKFSQELTEKIIEHVKSEYHDFNLPHTCEKLEERQQIRVSREKLRQIKIEAGIYTPAKVKKNSPQKTET